MGFVCPNAECLGARYVLSKKEAKKMHMRCDYAVCNAFLQEVDEETLQPCKIREDLAPVQSKCVVAPLTHLKKKCVVKATPDFVPVIPACIAPSWMVPQSAKSKSPHVEKKKVWPSKAHYFDGTFFRTIQGEVVFPNNTTVSQFKKRATAVALREEKRSVHERKRAAARRKAEQERTYKLKFKKVRSLVIEARRLMAIQERARLERAKARETVSPEELIRASEAQKSADKHLQGYRQLVWRVKQVRAAKRAACDASEASFFEVRAETDHDVLRLVNEPRQRPFLWAKRTGFLAHQPTTNPLNEVVPYKGLGAAQADPICVSVLRAGNMAATHPRLCSAIVGLSQGSYILQRGAAKLLESFTKSLSVIKDYYPEQALVEQVKNLITYEDLEQAVENCNEEASILQDEPACNAKAGFLSKLAKKVAAIPSDVYAYVKGGVQDLCASAAEGFFSVMVNKFREILADIKHEMRIATELIEVIIAKIRQWYNNILKAMDGILVTLGAYAFQALGILLGAGFIKLVCHAIGVTNASWLMSIFVSGVFAYVHMQATGGAEKAMDETKDLIKCMIHSLFTLSAIREHNARSVAVIGGVVAAISGFGKSLCAMNAASIIEIGKISAAFHSIRLGKEALKEMVGSICYYLGRLADKVTGRETTFLDEISLLVSVDMRGWIRRAQGCLLEANYQEIGSAIFRDTVNRLVAEGQKLQTGVNGLPRKISMDYAALIGQIMRELGTLQKKVIRSGTTEGRRPEPSWIYLWGPSHCGKSNYMATLGVELCKHFDLPYTVCPRNGKDEFFSGYSQQTILEIDDLSCCVTKDPPLESELINLVACKDHALKMADVEDKPIYFQSPFIISSSNFEDVPPGCGLRDVGAYRERKLCLVEFRRKPGEVFNSDDPRCHDGFYSQGRLKNPITQTLLPGQTDENSWMEIPDLTTEILNITARHRHKEEKLQNEFLRRAAVVDPVMLASEKFLKDEAHKCYADFPAVELEKAGIKAHPSKGLCVDGTLYLMQPDCAFKAFEVMDSGYAKLWQERTLKTFLPMIQTGTYLNSRSMVVTGFLRSLVNEEVGVLSVEDLTSNATFTQKRIFNVLQPTERVYLRALQISFDDIRSDAERNPFSDSYWAKVLGAMEQGRRLIVDHGGGVLILAAAICIILVVCWGFFKIFLALFAGATTLGGAAAAFGEVDAKSVLANQRKDGGYRARNIPVQHRYAYARDSSLLPAARLCVAIYMPGGAFVSAMQYKGKAIMMTRHQAKAISEGDTLTVIWASTGESKLVKWHEHHCIEMPGSEIVVWMAPTLTDLPPDLKGLFLEEAESELPSNFKTTGYVLRQDDKAFHYDVVESYVAVDKTPLVVRATVQNELYIHEMPEKLVFHYEARNHDCGMLMLFQHQGKVKVAGLLVAGVEKTSWACILPNPRIAELKSQIDFIPEFGEAEEGYFKAGYLTKDKAPSMPTKTNLVRVPPSLQIPLPATVEIKEPAVLSSADSRVKPLIDGSIPDPPKMALKKKFSKPMLPLEDDLLEDVAKDICSTWEKCSPGQLKDVPLSVAINGIPAGIGEESDECKLERFIMKTSPGYPYYMENRETGAKGKFAFFEEDIDGSLRLKEGSTAHVLYENLVQVTKTQVPEMVCIECPKDEPLPRRKVENYQCRLFEIMSLHFNLFLRVKTIEFTQFLQHNRHTLPCQVGVNPYSREWSHMFQRLRSKNDKAINCDYSGFDGLLIDQVVEVIAKMINRLYLGEDEYSAAQRFNMIMAMCGRYALVRSQVYKVNCGLPSGFALTVVVNSIFNEILIRYTYKKLAPAPCKNSFGVNVTLLVYGDDNLISCSPAIDSWFNGEAIRVVLADRNIKITDGSDKYAPTIEWKPLECLDFLKRGFKKTQSGVIQAPLDLSAIYTSLYWLTPDKSKFHQAQKPIDYVGEVDVLDELILNVNVALVEIYLHDDKELFYNVQQFYAKTLPKHAHMLRDWAYCESFHSAQQTGQQKYDPARVLDLMVGPEFSRFVRSAGDPRLAHWYTPVVGVCGTHYVPKNDEYVVSTEPLKPNVCGQHIPVAMGSGIGGLPTKGWVRKFGQPSFLKNVEGHLCLPAIRAEIESGKKVLFMAPPPYVANNAAAVMFASSSGYGKQRDLLAHYRASIPDSMFGLEQYFDAPVPQAAIGKSYFVDGMAYAALCEYKDGEVLNLDGTMQEKVNIACRQGKVPCLAAERIRAKHSVILACDSRMCPHHKATGVTYRAAFEGAWLSRCKTPAASVGTWFGTKLS